MIKNMKPVCQNIDNFLDNIVHQFVMQRKLEHEV
jgi:hypothetical protein